MNCFIAYLLFLASKLHFYYFTYAQYDRLFVENDVFLYNELEQRVERVLMKMTEGDKLERL